MGIHLYRPDFILGQFKPIILNLVLSTSIMLS